MRPHDEQAMHARCTDRALRRRPLGMRQISSPDSAEVDQRATFVAAKGTGAQAARRPVCSRILPRLQ